MQKDTTLQMRQNLAVRLLRVLRYNKARIERTISLLPDAHKPLFHILPYLLHINSPKLPGFVNDDTVPYGLFNFTLRPDVIKALERVFPELGDATEFAKRTWPKTRAIESILLMGSVGTIAQDEDSDFDYWVCIDGTRFSASQQKLLQTKITLIEKWAERNYGLEVHFFASDINKVKKNDFGVADGESAGSAQAVFLKAEFYTTNIVVAGRAPFWWLTPCHTSDKQYHSIWKALERGKSPDPDWLMDLGNLERMDPNELFGAAIWQLSKAMDSPFKSVLKMAKLEVFLENIDHHEPLCNELKQHVHQTDEGSGKVEPIDPYALMFDKLIEHYTRSEQSGIVRLLQECLYIKCDSKLSLPVTAYGRTFKHQIMSVYVTNWGWSEEKILELDNIESWSFAQHVQLSKRIHSFLIQCYRRMSGKFKNNHQLVSKRDMTVLGRRLETFYAKKPGKVDILRSGFGEELYCPIATIRAKRMPKGGKQWSLYSGDHLTAPDNEAKPYKVRTDLTATQLITWCVINRIIDAKSTLLLDYDSDPVTEEDLKQLTRYITTLFKPLKVNAIPREELLAPRRITECLAVLNFESARLKAEVDDIAVVYATNWGERYIEFGDNALNLRVEEMSNQDVAPQKLVFAPIFSHRKRLLSSFDSHTPVNFEILD